MVLRVAYTVEQCWHPTPGGTAVAALRVARELESLAGDVELLYVAGKHPVPPEPPYRPRASVAMLPLTPPYLYETWTRLNWPKVESVTGPIDVAHATGLIPCGTAAPLVVTLHDLAFRHDPSQFTRHGARLMSRSLHVITRRADLVLVPSEATRRDCVEAGVAPDRLRLVPLGVDAERIEPSAVERLRRRYGLPSEFVLFVGTIEPRKNLARLVAAMKRRDGDQQLVVAGADGWGDTGVELSVDSGETSDVRFLGFVPDGDLAALYGAASVVAYPSEREGFGLPVAEAMAQGTPVVTSQGTSTEEVAGGAAVLVDPFDVDSIAHGIDLAFEQAEVLTERGLRRAEDLTWRAAAEATLAAYRDVVA